MMRYLIIAAVLFLFAGCSLKVEMPQMPKTELERSNFTALKDFNGENFDEVVDIFEANCKSDKARSLYGDLCEKASQAEDKKDFIKDNFNVYRVIDGKNKTGMLTGYYEPELQGSLTKHDDYIYPLYKKPDDMYDVDFSSIYPELKKYHLKGRIEGNKVVPYYTRGNQDDMNASVLCYVNDKIDGFFLEIQGSGRVQLDSNETMYVGYAANNGQPYSSLGKYLAQIGEIDAKDMSLERIKEWAKNNPDKVDEILEHNKRMVFFRQRSDDVKGALGIALTPMRSVAVDGQYIPLGGMLYIDAKDRYHKIRRVVFAQDQGAAIKSPIRADFFSGFGEKALDFVGNLKADLKMWIFLPKSQK